MAVAYSHLTSGNATIKHKRLALEDNLQNIRSFTFIIAKDCECQDIYDTLVHFSKPNVKVPVDLHVWKPHQPMISTQSFDISDLALFCYSEDIEMYVAFSTSREKHFLHPESQKKLQPSTDNTSKGSDPILMAITNREFCKITKDENEFNLPVDMKFWRLSASRFIPNVAC
ncbi:RB1-inducible coiled-coil protein 1-like [Corticium candelabrum]|uniref:RB1-inducible coiled-coil protein 1-like n=1 Tax=Corticium candelabrum TaxID=121492 RepID=UPI002E2606B3|nr:RB1-inducible coiled-coil protein 1-like [Corticium candelabrum]XP_062507027.1 RB1-inducible coiled-coil protein 1-like [Corticium candelabrum]XP_062507028.1 RB1-inducible coiled-coil protein 1-like [Corticium candelabrum]